jgi:hypothetical protein
MSNVVKIWNGTTWINPFFLYPKIWNGTQWNYGVPKIWNGMGWINANSNGQVIDTWTLQVGQTVSGYPVSVVLTGYLAGSFGSLSPTTSTVFSGASVNSLYDTNSNAMRFSVISTATSSQFNTLTVNGVPYTSSSATFAWDGTNSTWTWSEVSGSPFPASGQSCVITLV